MTTAYRSDLVRTVYELEIANLAADLSISMEPAPVSCPKRDCVVQYRLARPTDASTEEIVKSKNAVAQAMQQHYCPHHPPKIEVD
jgi:hypothetical protein